MRELILASAALQVDNVKQPILGTLWHTAFTLFLISLVCFPEVEFVARNGNNLINDKLFIWIFEALKKKIIMLASIPI